MNLCTIPAIKFTATCATAWLSAANVSWLIVIGKLKNIKKCSVSRSEVHMYGTPYRKKFFNLRHMFFRLIQSKIIRFEPKKHLQNKSQTSDIFRKFSTYYVRQIVLKVGPKKHLQNNCDILFCDMLLFAILLRDFC